ncbi:MAG: shikimate dehydrogenase [Clostridia bacterium]|nr:shikimate dehydrogenase [Clostridia bacterium]
MKKLAVIGWPIAHSYSPLMHNYISREMNADYVYEAVETPPEKLGEIVSKLKADGVLGFNVTAPHKFNVMQYLDEISQDAQYFGAVNTVLNKNGKLIGYNTDAEGFYEALCYSGINPDGKHVLMLGAGGAAQPVAINLVKKCASLTVTNRTKERLFELKDVVKNCTGANIKTEIDRETYDIIINCTSLGMGNNIGMSPLSDMSIIGKDTYCVDMIYNPWETQFLKDAKKAGAKCVNGLSMLIFQGILAYRIFTGIDAPLSLADGIEKEILAHRNIVLTGFMASGKTVVGKALAEKLGRKFVDSDVLIEEKCGRTIPEIFEKYGEEYFRSVEAQVIEEISLEKGAVIATGGGVVLNGDNIAVLRKNATIVNLEPTKEVVISRLSNDDGTRPLNKGQDIEQILDRFENRKPFYDNCDVKVKITDEMSVEDSLSAVLKGLEGKI